MTDSLKPTLSCNPDNNQTLLLDHKLVDDAQGEMQLRVYGQPNSDQVIIQDSRQVESDGDLIRKTEIKLTGVSFWQGLPVASLCGLKIDQAQIVQTETKWEDRFSTEKTRNEVSISIKAQGAIAQPMDLGAIQIFASGNEPVDVVQRGETYSISSPSEIQVEIADEGARRVKGDLRLVLRGNIVDTVEFAESSQMFLQGLVFAPGKVVLWGGGEDKYYNARNSDKKYLFSGVSGSYVAMGDAFRADPDNAFLVNVLDQLPALTDVTRGSNYIQFHSEKPISMGRNGVQLVGDICVFENGSYSGILFQDTQVFDAENKVTRTFKKGTQFTLNKDFGAVYSGSTYDNHDESETRINL